MKSSTVGKSTLKAEVANVSMHGIWILVKKIEYFLPYEEFPWFKDAKISDIFDLELLHQCHLRWNRLDLDMELSSLENLEQYPLKYH